MKLPAAHAAHMQRLRCASCRVFWRRRTKVCLWGAHYRPALARRLFGGTGGI